MCVVREMCVGAVPLPGGADPPAHAAPGAAARGELGQLQRAQRGRVAAGPQGRAPGGHHSYYFTFEPS